MKKMFRLTAVLAAAALAAGLMVGCSTVPSYGDSTTVAPTDTVLLLEQGEAVPALTNPEDFTENINTRSTDHHGWSAAGIRAGQVQR